MLCRVIRAIYIYDKLYQPGEQLTLEARDYAKYSPSCLEMVQRDTLPSKAQIEQFCQVRYGVELNKSWGLERMRTTLHGLLSGALSPASLTSKTTKKEADPSP
ncbi:hypothetical protein [Magnetococcus sp. PR-3]|uniref:hypothetical protein n=1 Tax=Magnetococcus sp. PR-3 TaxID=3120355 RepID=UPI002FCDF610